MNRESGIFRNEFVRNDSRKNWGNLQKFIFAGLCSSSPRASECLSCEKYTAEAPR